MYQQRVKWLQIGMTMLGLASLLTIFTLIKHFYVLLIIALYCIAFGTIAEGILSHLEYKKQTALRLLLFGVLLIVITTILFVYRLKS